jgi:predicted restriction endonuclease
MLDAIEQPPMVARDSSLEDNPVQERWERRIVSEIRHLDTIAETEREQIIDARVGQGRFRSLVYAHERRCRVTRVDRPEHLIASHIRPWRHADNQQRLDPENGLMLTPNVDHLFDRGFITFSTTGRLIYSPAVDRESVLRMGFDPDVELDVGTFSNQQKQHLEFHRDEVFLSNRR